MKKIKDRKTRVHISFFVMIVFTVYAIVMILQQGTIIKDQKIKEENLVIEKSSLTAKLNALENELEHFGTFEYVEQIARERLGWVKEGEIKFVEIK